MGKGDVVATMWSLDCHMVCDMRNVAKVVLHAMISMYLRILNKILGINLERERKGDVNKV
jgi:hypothetical protein